MDPAIFFLRDKTLLQSLLLAPTSPPTHNTQGTFVLHKRRFDPFEPSLRFSRKTKTNQLGKILEQFLGQANFNGLIKNFIYTHGDRREQPDGAIKYPPLAAALPDVGSQVSS